LHYHARRGVSYVPRWRPDLNTCYTRPMNPERLRLEGEVVRAERRVTVAREMA